MKEHRRTALVVAAILGGLAALSIWRGHAWRAGIFGGCAVTLAALGCVSAGFAARFHRFWMRAADALGRANTFLILAFTYFVGFTAFGFLSRVLGHDPLGRRSPVRQSYWVKRAKTRQSHWQYERLY
jgi:hypothetical protein